MSAFAANHHLPEHVLLSYSAGALPEAFSLVVACHLSMCDECRAVAESYDTLGGTLIEGLSPAELGADSLAATMARIEGGAPEAAPPISRAPSAFPAPLQAYAGPNPDAVRWKTVGGGVRQALLPSGGRETVRLLYIPGGTAVPSHGHDGMEMTLVLQGAFSDAHGRYARGDLEYRDEPESHQPVAEEGDACICLAATEGPLRFDALLPRLLGPFIRI